MSLVDWQVEPLGLSLHGHMRTIKGFIGILSTIPNTQVTTNEALNMIHCNDRIIPD